MKPAGIFLLSVLPTSAFSDSLHKLLVNGKARKNPHHVGLVPWFVASKGEVKRRNRRSINQTPSLAMIPAVMIDDNSRGT